MSKFFNSSIGGLRLIALLEGSSLLFLVFIAAPMKRLFDMPQGTEIIGPIHGVLFLLFIALTLFVSFQKKWKFTKTTWKVLVSSFIPFGTFYIDHTILKKEHTV